MIKRRPSIGIKQDDFEEPEIESGKLLKTLGMQS
jgi:hypothetical protein